jgi:hypothetical protein
MVYETKVIDKEAGIIRVTFSDERWYSKGIGEKVVWIPSTTWICGYYPKGVPYFKWLASKGWDESIAIMEAAGEHGTYVHKGSEMLMNGSTLRFDTIVDDRQLTTEEYAACLSFMKWFHKHSPQVLKVEFTVFGHDDTHAGTVDLICIINGTIWIIDFKTGQYVWPSHEIQLSAYKHTVEVDEIVKKYKLPVRLGILQLGYKKNKDHFKFMAVEDKWELFLAARQIWANECAGISPLVREYPLELKLNLGGKSDESAKD